MGIIGRIFGRGGISAVSGAVTNVAEVFTPNATRRMELGHEAFVASVTQHGTEFTYGGALFFDRLINGLNRLPRPMLALGTLGLFIYAMVDPISFAERMEGLAYVPDPLWWLLGAIVSFYFGARELHYRRTTPPPVKKTRVAAVTPSEKTAKPIPRAQTETDNPALIAWKSTRGDEGA